MTAGIQIFNSSGTTQIDSEFRNLEFKSKATLTHSQRDGQFTAWFTTSTARLWDYKDITITGTNPLIAMLSPNVSANEGMRVHKLTNNNNGTFTARMAWADAYPGGGSSPTYTYYVFDNPGSPPAGAMFEIYNAVGNLVYAGEQKPMKVVHATFAGDTETWSETLQSGVSGRLFAGVIGRTAGTTFDVYKIPPGPESTTYGPAIRGGASGQPCIAANFPIYSFGGIGGYSLSTNQCPILCVEVTGY